MLYLCQIQVARSPRLWKHVGSPFASLVVLDQSRSVSRVRAIGHRWWRDHPKLCKPASMQILSGTSRPRWCCHLLQSWLVWGAPCLLCCPAAPSAPPSVLSLEHPEWKVAKETRAKNEFAKKNIICLNWLPQLSNIVEAGPAETLWITFKIMGEPFLITFNFDTALPICLETDSDEPMKRYELIIEIDCSVLKVRLFNRVEAGKYIRKNWPTKNWDVMLVNRNCF